MDLLKQCIFDYQKLLNKDFYLTLENDLVIKVFFAKKHFHHLLGLGKLNDITQLIITAKNDPTTIYKNIDKGIITYEDLEKSIHFNDIKERMDNFKYLNSMMFEKVIINFDKSKVKSTKIRSDIILFQDKGPYYLHLCLCQDQKLYYFPETFLVQHDDYYIKDQAILKVKAFKIVDVKTNKVIHNYIQTDEETAATLDNNEG